MMTIYHVSWTHNGEYHSAFPSGTSIADVRERYQRTLACNFMGLSELVVREVTTAEYKSVYAGI